MLTWRLLAPVVLVSFVALFSGCSGGAEKVDADDWADDFCDAATELSDAEADAYFEYDDIRIDNEDDGDAVRDAAGEYLDTYSEALEDFLDALEDAGEPDVDGGGEIIKAIKEFVEQELEALEEAQDDIDDLDEDDDEELAFAVDEVILDIEYADLLPLLEDADSKEADDVIELIEDDEDCANFLFTS